MRRIVRAAPVVFVLLLGSPAASAQTSIALLGVDAADSPVAFASCLAEGIKAEVRKAPGLRLVPGKDLDEIKLVFGCVEEEPDCMARVGKSLQASKLLWGALKKAGPSFNFTIKLLDVAEARIEKFATENLKRSELAAGCAKKTLGRILSSLIAVKKAEIKVTANVAGAQVLLNAQIVGLTNGEPVAIKDLSPGSFGIQVKKDGYKPFAQTVEIRGDESVELTATLEALQVTPGTPDEGTPASQPVTKKSRTGWRVAFWTGAALTVGFGVAIGVTGSTVLSLQEDKEKAIKEFQQTWKVSDGKAPFQSDDACNEVTSYPNATAVKDACDSGKSRAVLTNVFIGLTLAMAATTGFFYYKAYIADDSPSAGPEKDEPADREHKAARAGRPAVDWSLSPTLGPAGGGLGFSLSY
jgi:hypothetical protein